ncbi:MAG: peptidoglycan DD-metalloendopeptidase family protein [Myxococcales bacterium]|nr:peptidoglycan DD-metalloendopeptidase family protein [Myxococcales bacterium]
MNAWTATCLAAAMFFASACGPRTPPALRPDLSDRYRVHVLQPNDTLYRVALRYGVTVEDLVALNEIRDVTKIAAGTRLLIPDGGQSLEIKPRPAEPAPRLSEPAPEPLDACPSRAPVSLPIGAAGYAWPVDGVVLARFGTVDGSPHPGLAIGAPLGTVVWASRAGEVTFSGPQAGFGNVVIVEHGPGAFTVYGRTHLLCVEEGDQVERGQVIARVGDAGGTGVPYLYFELREDGRPIDPQPRLPTMDRPSEVAEARRRGYGVRAWLTPSRIGSAR